MCILMQLLHRPVPEQEVLPLLACSVRSLPPPPTGQTTPTRMTIPPSSEAKITTCCGIECCYSYATAPSYPLLLILTLNSRQCPPPGGVVGWLIQSRRIAGFFVFFVSSSKVQGGDKASICTRSDTYRSVSVRKASW